MLNLERLRNAVLQATGFDALPDGFTLVDTVNECHQQWVTEATWSYLGGRRYVVAVTAAEDYELPQEVGEVQAAWIGDPHRGYVQMVEAEQFEKLRGLGATRGTHGFYGTVRWRPSTTTDPETRAVLSLYPAPTMTTEQVTVVYRTAAVRVEDETAILDLPLPLEPVFLEFFRAYCRGTMLAERDLTTELQRVRTSTMFRAALSAQSPFRTITPTLGDAGEHYATGMMGRDFYARRYD